MNLGGKMSEQFNNKDYGEYFSAIEKSLDKNSQAVCYADGKFFCELNSSPLIVKKSDKKFKMFLLKKDFFKRLNQKLKR